VGGDDPGFQLAIAAVLLPLFQQEAGYDEVDVEDMVLHELSL
jgi:hypothetical protein